MSERKTSSWTILTNHAQVLLCITEDGDITLRDLGHRVGITEHAAQRMVADLVESGFIQRQRLGRRNHYAIDRTTTMRRVAQADQIRRLVDLLQQRDEPDSTESRRPPSA
jgi:predicted ArsR family transcriptional regulator